MSYKTSPSNDEIDAELALAIMGYDRNDKYPEWSNSAMREAYRAGWEDGAAAEAILTTQAELDGLPFLAIIREVYRPSPGSGTDYGGVYERRTSGWHSITGTYRDAPDNGTPKLPCRVLYNPA